MNCVILRGRKRASVTLLGKYAWWVLWGNLTCLLSFFSTHSVHTCYNPLHLARSFVCISPTTLSFHRQNSRTRHRCISDASMFPAHSCTHQTSIVCLLCASLVGLVPTFTKPRQTEAMWALPPQTSWSSGKGETLSQSSHTHSDIYTEAPHIGKSALKKSNKVLWEKSDDGGGVWEQGRGSFFRSDS